MTQESKNMSTVIANNYPSIRAVFQSTDTTGREHVWTLPVIAWQYDDGTGHPVVPTNKDALPLADYLKDATGVEFVGLIGEQSMVPTHRVKGVLEAARSE